MTLKERIEGSDYVTEHELTDGRIVTLVLEEDFSEVSFYDQSGTQLGKPYDFCFEEGETENSYLLARMYTPITRQGLGRAAVQLFVNTTGLKIHTRPHDGHVRSDGSHLTGDAFAFVIQMQEEGLISEWDEPDYED